MDGRTLGEVLDNLGITWVDAPKRAAAEETEPLQVLMDAYGVNLLFGLGAGSGQVTSVPECFSDEECQQYVWAAIRGVLDE